MGPRIPTGAGGRLSPGGSQESMVVRTKTRFLLRRRPAEGDEVRGETGGCRGLGRDHGLQGQHRKERGGCTRSAGVAQPGEHPQPAAHGPQRKEPLEASSLSSRPPHRRKARRRPAPSSAQEACTMRPAPGPCVLGPRPLGASPSAGQRAAPRRTLLGRATASGQHTCVEGGDLPVGQRCGLGLDVCPQGGGPGQCGRRGAPSRRSVRAIEMSFFLHRGSECRPPRRVVRAGSAPALLFARAQKPGGRAGAVGVAACIQPGRCVSCRHERRLDWTRHQGRHGTLCVLRQDRRFAALSGQPRVGSPPARRAQGTSRTSTVTRLG